MKRVLILAVCLCQIGILRSQISYINITNHNTGSGTNNLFDHYVSTSQTCYIDWEVGHPAMSSGDACGTKSASRLILRRTSDNDPTSVVASAPIIITGVCNGKSGNYDKYYVNLGPYITVAGRYSVEIQADVLPLAGTAYDNSNTRTNYNYMCPPANYLTGSGGTTGSYYTAPGTCNYGGLSDPVGGGTTIDKIPEINSSLKYFTVGQVGTYREMVVFDGDYYDMLNGKFQPGNPRVPSSLNGIPPIPSYGICAAGPTPVLSMGAEINVFKRTDCSADVTGAKMFYRVYNMAGTAPAYSSFTIAFKDNCPGPSGPNNNVFTSGGSCNNINSVTDQRWQSATGVSNILPATLTPADSGTWKIEFYLETYVKNCAGTTQTITSTVNSTTFTVIDPNSTAGAVCAITPVYFKNVSAVRNYNGLLLNWEMADAYTASEFIPEVSFDGKQFQPLKSLKAMLSVSEYRYADMAFDTYHSSTVYYRIKAKTANGHYLYSRIIKADKQPASAAGIQVFSSGQSAELTVRGLQKGRYELCLYTAEGLLQQRFSFNHTLGETANLSVPLPINGTASVYVVVIRDQSGKSILSRKFIR